MYHSAFKRAFKKNPAHPAHSGNFYTSGGLTSKFSVQLGRGFRRLTSVLPHII